MTHCYNKSNAYNIDNYCFGIIHNRISYGKADPVEDVNNWKSYFEILQVRVLMVCDYKHDASIMEILLLCPVINNTMWNM